MLKAEPIPKELSQYATYNRKGTPVLTEAASAAFRENYRIYAADRRVAVSDVANKMGMQRSTLSQILSGKRPFRLELDIAQRVADMMGIGFDNFLAANHLYMDTSVKYLLMNPEVQRFLANEKGREYLKAVISYDRTGDADVLVLDSERIREER